MNINRTMRQSVKKNNQRSQKRTNGKRQQSLRRNKNSRSSVVTQRAPSAFSNSFSPFMDSKPYNRRGIPGVRVSGAEYLTTLQSTTPDTLGTALYTIALNPSSWVGTRLQILSRLYEKYSVNSLKFKFLTSTPTNVPGSMVGGFDYDVTDSLIPESDQGVRQLMVSPGACWHAVWQNAEYMFIGPDDQQFWLERSDGTSADRLTTPGRFISVLAAGISGGSITLGGIIVEYDLNLHIPQYETPVPIPFIQVNSMLTNTVTTANGVAYQTKVTGANTATGQIYSLEVFQRSASAISTAIKAGARYYAIATDAFGSLNQLYNTLDGLLADIPSTTVKATAVVVANTILANYVRLTNVNPGGGPAN